MTGDGASLDLPRVEPFGDGAILVTLGSAIDGALAERAQLLADIANRRRADDPRFGRAVPGFATLVLPFDPLAVELDAALAIGRELLDELADGPGQAGSPPDARSDETIVTSPVDIPTRYGGVDGPDLDELAAELGLTAAAVVELHASVTYTCFLLGFAPGFAYLGSVPEAIAMPRRAAPRSRVSPGSVGIAGQLTGIYPRATAGGWNLIGRTEVRLWDVRRSMPARIEPGGRVRFIPIRD